MQPPATLVCRSCNTEKPLDRFVPHRTCRWGRSRTCRDCRNSDARKYWAANAEKCRSHHRKKRQAPKYRKLEADKARAVGTRRRAEIAALKDVPCADCGGRFPHYVMDFDHRDPAEKSFVISKRAASCSIAALRAEVLKCDVVCANCHRIRTFKARGW